MMTTFFIPFVLNEAPRRAVEAVLDAQPVLTCPNHPDEPLEFDRPGAFSTFQKDNALKLTAFRPGEHDFGRRWLDEHPDAPCVSLPVELDRPPSAVLAEWQATLAPDRAPLASLSLSLDSWLACDERDWVGQIRATAARASVPPGPHYVLRPERKPCLACAVAAVGVPPILQGASFANFDHRDEQLTKHLALCQAFAKDPKGFLLFMGGVGGGKTHLAVAITRATVAGPMKPLLLSHQRLLELHRQHYQPLDPDNPPEDIVGQCRAAGILVLDDLGRRQVGKDEENILHAVLNHRYEHMLPTVLTGNLDQAGLRAVLGDALFDRLSENNYAYLTFGVSSYRPHKRDAYLAAAPAALSTAPKPPARPPPSAPSRQPGRGLPLWQQVKYLEKQIQDHRANPDSGCDSFNVTKAHDDELKALRAKLAALLEQA